jgi:hypothetical protein
MNSSPSLKRVGECLYRNPASDRYYAVVRVRGKQFKSSLKTDKLAVARRKLKDFRNDLARHLHIGDDDRRILRAAEDREGVTGGGCGEHFIASM